MSTFEYDGNTFEVEVKKMGGDVINIAFLDEDDFGLIMGWVNSADLSHLVFENEPDDEGNEREPDVYDGYTVFNAIVAFNATENDFWEGLRIVVALAKPNGE